ncbi:sugar-binding transcriptional regulator [Agromyces sp. MMS24-K17]|uniref:sugar-binding transcriptional regulator n=1 Tax=Agromyces sp. MMS24-K17 TaxID=3372850 RepID=UPI003754DE6B
MPDASLPARTRQALRAAQLYYLQDLTMEAIARELGTSRSSVSRLISHARDTGLVEITIHSPLDSAGRLEEALRTAHGVAAHVVPVPDDATEVDRLDRVAMTAAHLVGGFVDENQVIGLAWGSTMTAVSRHLVPRATHGTSIVQLNGAGNLRTSGILYASELLRRFGDAFGAEVEQFPVPAFFDDPATREALWRERSVRRILALQGRMDVAVFGIGSPFADVPSRVYQGGYLERADYAALSRDHVVGDVATVFYRADGSTGGIALNARGTGPDFAVLRRAPRRVCVVSGRAKLPALRGALAAGLVTDLVVDEGTARALVDEPAAEASRRPR